MNEEVLIKLVEEIILKKYKVSEDALRSVVLEELYKSPKLLEALRTMDSSDKLQRMSVYKNFVKKVSKDIYYSLRQYHHEDSDPVMEHISTKERDDYKEEFFSQLLKTSSDIKNLIDIGGGVFPLTFPFEKFPNLEKYIWVDKDVKAFNTLSQLKNPKLVLYNEPIGMRSWEEYLPQGFSFFDLALMIKVVSVVDRQQPHLLPVLSKVPAKMYLVTSPKEAMVKKQDVEKREEKTLHKFIELTGRNVQGRLDIPNEFGYFLS